MNEQQQATEPPQHDGPGAPSFRREEFVNVRRPREDRMIAGVCTAIARWLNIDPVIVRIAFVVLAFVGLAGFILYLAGWLLIPDQGHERSAFGEAFGVGDNDAQIRMIGLAVAAGLALVAVLGDSAWGLNGWGWASIWITFWVGAPLALGYWLLVGRHRPTSAAPSPTTAPPGAPREDLAGAAEPPPARPSRERNWSPALVLGTVSTMLLAWGALWLWSVQTAPVSIETYAAVALGIAAIGLLVGTKIGDAGLLVPIGFVLTAVLLASAALPSVRTGDFRFTPTSVAQATRTVETGVGEVTYDLTQLSDPSALAGREVRIAHGAGVVRVIVPRELDVDVDARVRWGGQVEVFDQRREGWDASLHVESEGRRPFAISIINTAGVIEVIRS